MAFATARALTLTAKAVEQAGIARMRAVISDPRPYTLRAQQVTPASRDNLNAAVEFRQRVGVGIGAGKYLRPLEFGGARGPKRSEVALRSTGMIGPNEFVTPAKGGPLDNNGPAIGGIYRRIIAAAKMSPVRFNAKGTRRLKSRRKARYWRNGMIIWERVNGDAARPVLIVTTKTPSYAPKLGFAALADKVSREKGQAIYDASVRDALASAR